MKTTVTVYLLESTFKYNLQTFNPWKYEENLTYVLATF